MKTINPGTVRVTDETLDLLQNVFSGFENIDKTVLYGSRVKGNFKSGSDINFSLFGKDLNQHIIFDILEKIDRLYLPYKCEFTIYEKSKIRN